MGGGSVFSVLLDLGGQVVAEVAKAVDLELDHARRVAREADGHAAGERAGLREDTEVAQGEGERQRLLHLDRDGGVVLARTRGGGGGLRGDDRRVVILIAHRLGLDAGLLLHVLLLDARLALDPRLALHHAVGGRAGAQEDEALAEVGARRELDALARDGDGDGVAEDGHVAADLGEVGGAELDRRRVRHLGDGHALRVDLHELELELALLRLVLRLSDDGQDVAVVDVAEGDDVVVLGGLEDLAERLEVDAQHRLALARVHGEAAAAERQGDERDVRGVHGLDADARRRGLEVGLGDELLDRLHDLLPQQALGDLRFEHGLVAGWDGENQ
mmetsp:Transcript_25832/g.79718  ORF Transcript_25832/g.79718 Transcript_25832/m.79718 type:complete len:331 (-) Transcript_25832:20-1012(-)